MAMTVKRRKEVKTPSVIMHKIADIRGGVTISTEDLGGDYIREGAFIAAPVNGICRIYKTAIVAENADESAEEIKVEKFHNFRVGDRLELQGLMGSVEKTISDIKSGKDYDTFVFDSNIGGDQVKGGVIMAHRTLLPDSPAVAIVGTGKPIERGENVITDAWAFAVTKGNPQPFGVMHTLKGIVNI